MILVSIRSAIGNYLRVLHTVIQNNILPGFWLWSFHVLLNIHLIGELTKNGVNVLFLERYWRLGSVSKCMLPA